MSPINRLRKEYKSPNQNLKVLGQILNILRDFIPFGQFKKRGKQIWGSVTFRKVAD